LGGAVGWAVGGRPVLAGRGVVAVVAAVAGVLGAVPVERPVLVTVEAAQGVLAAAAIALTLAAPDRLHLTSLALAALGVTALGGALRPGRRWYAALGTVLLLAAWWVLLGRMSVTAPEPYLLPPAVAAVVVGWEWRRRARAEGGKVPGSWVALAPGVGLGLLPSLTAVFLSGGDALRLGLLAAAATVVVVAAARLRLQAPLLLGASVLLLAALRGFSAPLWELIVAIPAWIPWALAGLLMVAVAARFERSTRDLRRIGHMLRAME
jgi:hypothetical protein